MRRVGPAVLVVLGLIGLGTLLGLPAPAQAQQAMPCGERSDLIAQLREKFKEMPAGIGMTGAGGVMELLTSDDGSWSLIVTMPNGRSCLISTGEGWESIPRMKGRDT